MALKERTISYLRAVTVKGEDFDLEAVVEDLLKDYQDAASTELDQGNFFARIQHRDKYQQSTCLHIATWNYRESTSVVRQDNDNLPNTDLETIPPPSERDWLHGDAMVLISENHCLITPSGMRLPQVRKYLIRLINEYSSDTIELINVFDSNILEILDRDGVKEVSLNIGTYRWSTLTRNEEKRTKNRVGQLARSITSVLEDDETRDEMREEEFMNVVVTFKSGRGYQYLSTEDLNSIALEAIEEEEDMTQFVTKSGTRFSQGAFIHRKKVKLPAFGKTVFHNPTWSEMRIYFDELDQLGYLEE